MGYMGTRWYRVCNRVLNGGATGVQPADGRGLRSLGVVVRVDK